MKKLPTLLLCLLLLAFSGAAMGKSFSAKKKRVVSGVAAPDLHWIDTNVYALLIDYGTNGTAALDSSGNDYHMTNLPTMATGPARTLVTNSLGDECDYWFFDNASTYFKGPHVSQFDGASAFTMGMWKYIWTNSLGGYISQHSSVGSNEISMAWYGTGGYGEYHSCGLTNANSEILITTANSSTNVGEWQFIVYQFDGSQALGSRSKWYVNAVSRAIATDEAYTPASNTAQLTVGYHTNYFGYFGPGYLDFFFVMPYNCGAEVITNLFQNTHPTNNIRKRN